MKIFLILFLLIVYIQPVFSDTRYVTTVEPLQGYYNDTASYESNRIAEIENNIYGQVFNGENILSRLERLEMDVFNRTYPNSSIDQRINNIVYTYRRNAQVVQSKSNNKGKLKSILNNLSGAFIGVPTGYTPSIYSDSYSTPYYSIGSNGIGQHYGQYSDYYGPNGWNRYNHGYGTSSGIHIMD